MTSRPRVSASREHLRPDAVGANDHRRALADLVERVDGLDPLGLERGDDAFVVDDLAEGVRPLAGRRGFLGLVDGLAHAVAEPGAARDPDFSNVTHCASVSHGSRDDHDHRRARLPCAPSPA